MLKSKMDYALPGGRDEGYRGYTYKKKIYPGKWRVKIKTEQRKTLGYINFVVQPATDGELEFTDVRF